ncbi:hypothetical protein BD413DRAFT_613648 [Trametes elegans]|nr:hypothetical protein BD413DRAFT_613648 [Trametes elegans]
MAPPRCEACEKDSGSTDLKLRAGCHKIWYCSKERQKAGWVFHIFDCRHGKPISTVYYLSKALVHFDTNLLDLHEACVRGKLVAFLHKFVKLKPETETYKRLLRNGYPGRWQGERAGVAPYRNGAAPTLDLSSRPV